MFVGRDKELEQLERIYNQRGFYTVLVTGAPGIGKTAFIEEFCKRKNNIFFIAPPENSVVSLKKFSALVRSHYDDNSTEQFASWGSAFTYMAEKSQNKRLIVVIDDLHNLTDRNPAFAKSLQTSIERDLLSSNIMLIISGNVNSCREILDGEHAITRNITAVIKLDTLPEDEVKKLTMNVNQAKMLRFSADEVILKEGETNTDVYKIISGRAVCYLNQGKEDELVVGGLKEENTFGEYSVLTGEPEIYSVVAFSEVLLLRISRSEFEQFITMNAANSLEIMTNMAKMLKVLKTNIGMISSESI